MEAINQIYNVAFGERTSLNTLYRLLQQIIGNKYSHVNEIKPVYRDFRSGDVRHSQAKISKANRLLGYEPVFGVEAGIKELIAWYYQIH